MNLLDAGYFALQQIFPLDYDVLLRFACVRPALDDDQRWQKMYLSRSVSLAALQKDDVSGSQ